MNNTSRSKSFHATQQICRYRRLVVNVKNPPGISYIDSGGFFTSVYITDLNKWVLFNDP